MYSNANVAGQGNTSNVKIAGEAMPIELKCANTACTTVMAVKEEHAGKSVKCPNCGTVTVVPSPSAPAAPAAPVVATASTPLPEPGVAAPAGGNVMETVRALALATSLDDLGLYALGGGLFALGVLILSTMLPPYTIIGAFLFLVTVGVEGFVLVSFAKMHVFFEKAVYAAAGWGAFVFMVLILMMLATEVGIGSYLGLLASVGVAAAFGFLSHQRVMK